MKNGIIGEEEEAMIVAGAEERSFSEMRNDLPKFLKRLVVGKTRIKGMLIIRRSFICQGIDCGIFRTHIDTKSNEYLLIKGTEMMLMRIPCKYCRDLYKIVDAKMVETLSSYKWHYAKGEKEPYAYTRKGKK